MRRSPQGYGGEEAVKRRWREGDKKVGRVRGEEEEDERVNGHKLELPIERFYRGGFGSTNQEL